MIVFSFNKYLEDPNKKKKELKSTYLLCISTSEWVFRMPFAGQNNFFDAETTFFHQFPLKNI